LSFIIYYDVISQTNSCKNIFTLVKLATLLPVAVTFTSFHASLYVKLITQSLTLCINSAGLVLDKSNVVDTVALPLDKSITLICCLSFNSPKLTASSSA
tara:strand:+ start:96 stop:392 length:297 start_codon:yes stop_codon:yes gene_type:complete